MPRAEPQMRECCLTRQSKPVAELIRFALSPEGLLLPDVDARAPGRGVWVTASEDAVQQAAARKAFARSLKASVQVPQDLAERTGQALEQRLLGALGLARKAGQLLTGATKVRGLIDKGGITALFTAKDAAPDGRNKMTAALKSRGLDLGVPHFEYLVSEQLSLALGLGNVIHAALTEGSAARSALARAQRLERFRQDKM